MDFDITKASTSINKFIGYEMPPFFPKNVWMALGDYISSKEHEPVMVVPNDKCYTIRLDIRSMSKYKKKFLQFTGEANKDTLYSPIFGQFMVDTTKVLCKEFSAHCAFTQSDEITLLIKPSEKPEFQHKWGGKRDKIISDSSVTASLTFGQMLNEKTINISFDSRLAVWDSVEDAMKVLYWRAYDTSVNGVSDAVLTAPIRKQLIGKCTIEKLRYLEEAGKLPLPHHQAYGTYIIKTMKIVQGTNPKTGQLESALRSIWECLPTGIWSS